MIGNIPESIHDVTSEWLKQTLGASSIHSVAPRLVGEQGLSTVVARVEFQQKHDARSLIVKLSAEKPETRRYFSRFYEREVMFYNELRDAIPLRTPRCYFAAYQPVTATHCILLEDLAPAAAGSTAHGVAASDAYEFAQRIATLHAHWWEHAELPSLAARLPAYGANFAVGYHRVLQHGLAILQPWMTTRATQLADQLQQGLQARWERQWQAPRTLMHWDAHAGNLMLPTSEGGDWAVVDWQNIVVGAGIWDVTRFCALSLTAADRHRNEREIVLAYARELATLGVDADSASLEASYRALLPVVFAQQLRFFTTIDVGASRPHDAVDGWSDAQRAWRDAVAPRVVAALIDASAVRPSRS